MTRCARFVVEPQVVHLPEPRDDSISLGPIRLESIAISDAVSSRAFSASSRTGVLEIQGSGPFRPALVLLVKASRYEVPNFTVFTLQSAFPHLSAPPESDTTLFGCVEHSLQHLVSRWRAYWFLKLLKVEDSMMSSRRITIVLLLALVAAMAISVVRGDDSSQELASDGAVAAVRRELRRRGAGVGGNNSSARPSAFGGSSLALALGISSLLAGALLQDII
ncbi:hypothetical protein M758_1G259100 [Ceratodon purpureus]|nr:hypothetical protein M758_1G259100 [Ceratodon purpureus]